MRNPFKRKPPVIAEQLQCESPQSILNNAIVKDIEASAPNATVLELRWHTNYNDELSLTAVVMVDSMLDWDTRHKVYIALKKLEDRIPCIQEIEWEYPSNTYVEWKPDG